MDIRMFPLPFAVLIAFAAIAYLFIAARGNWKFRLALIIALPAYLFTVWPSMPTYFGWPSPEPPPAKLVFVWAVIQRPGERYDTPRGAIYLWAQQVPQGGQREPGLFDYEYRYGEPRAYVFPYSPQLHQQVAAAMGKVKAGVPVMIGLQAPHRGDRDGGGQQHRRDEAPQFYELPPPRIEKKGSGK